MKRNISIILALTLLASLIIAPAAMAKDSNHVDYWENENLENQTLECVKDDTERGNSWTSDGNYAMVILKSSGDNETFAHVSEERELFTETGKDISHIIMCVAVGEPDPDPDYEG